MAPHVLVVEDDRANGVLFEQALQLNAYPVTLLRDGLSALAHLQQYPTDILIINAGLPGGLSGYDVIRRTRDIPTCRHLRVMLISARAIQLPPDLTKAVHCCLQKPFTVQQLLQELEQLAP